MIIVMGVAGSGKTTVGKKLAEVLNCPFYEGDDFHPVENARKMKTGEALTDEDREPWLKLISEKMKEWRKQNSIFVLACSALKAKYRRILESNEKLKWIYLKGNHDLVHRRLLSRAGHFFPTQLLETQFHDLEEPTEALVVDIALPVDKMVEKIHSRLNLEN